MQQLGRLLLLCLLTEARATLEPLIECCRGNHIKIGTPAIPGGYEPLFTYNDGVWGGLLVEMFDSLSLNMGFSYEIVASPAYDVDPATGLGMLQAGSVDLVITDLSPAAVQQDLRVLKTGPFHNSYFSGLVLKTSKPYSLFRFMDPFDLNMYLTMLAVIIGTAFLLSALDLIWPTDEGSLKGKHQLCDGVDDCRDLFRAFTASIYHMTAATLGGEDYEWLTSPLKVLRIGMLLVVLVVNATYTANLAAFLSAPSTKVHGPQSMDELSGSVVCVLSEGEWASNAARSFGGSMITASQEELPDGALGSLSNLPERKQWVSDKLDAGECDVWLHDITVIQGIYLANCASRELTSFISVSPILYGFVGVDPAVVGNVSAGLAGLSATPAFEQATTAALPPYQTSAPLHPLARPRMLSEVTWPSRVAQVKRSYFGTGLQCSAEDADSDTTPISAEMMAGVYIIYAVIVGLAVSMAVGLRVKFHLGLGASDTLSHTATDGEMLRALVGKIDTLMDADAGDGDGGGDDENGDADAADDEDGSKSAGHVRSRRVAFRLSWQLAAAAASRCPLLALWLR